MDVGELLNFQPRKPAVKTGSKRRHGDEESQGFDPKAYDAPSGGKKSASRGLTDDDKERILKMVEDEDQSDTMDEAAFKKMILQFEKRVSKNQEMRIKFPDIPEKFLESEMELNMIIHEMHVMATVPEFYHILTDLRATQTMLQLLNHDNTDISIAIVDLLQEMTDGDALTEYEEGATALIDALMEGQVVAQLVQNLERLDETVKEESEGVHNTLAILENICDLRPDLCTDIAQQGILTWLLRRIKAKMPFDGNKLYTSEILSILLQNHNDNRQLLGEQDGIDILLQQLAAYKRHDPVSSEEIEYMENLFDAMCSALMLPNNKERFLKGEGLQLMNLLLREKKLSRSSAVKVLNHAMSGPQGLDNCHKFVDILGLRNIFPLFMKTPKPHKKVGPNKQELDEHIISIIASMVRNTTSTQRQRLLQKFVENDHEKVDRLMELHFQYLDRVRHADERIQKEKNDMSYLGEEADEEMEDQFYLRRLEAGLFTLQLIDFVMMEISVGGPQGVKQRVIQILNMRGGSIKAIKSIMREYAGNIGDAENTESQEEEQQKILQLVERF